MNPIAAIEYIKFAIQQLVQITLHDLDNLSANNVSVTMLALLRYQGSRPSQTLERLSEKLLQRQLPNGSWNDELWATGLALWAQQQMLEQQGRSLNLKTPFVRKALSYIENTRNEQRWNWQGEFFETILLCWLLPRIGYRREDDFVQRAILRLKEKQSSDGALFDVYDTALALLAFKTGQDILEMDNIQAIARAVEWLKRCSPHGESVWSRAVMLYAIAELKLREEIWASSILDSLLDEFQGGLISDDHDEQAMAVLAICAYLATWWSKQLASQRIPVDSLVRVLQYEDFLRSSRTALNAKLEAANVASSSKERMFSYTDAFVKNKDDLFASIHEEKQFRSMVSAFYMLFYEGSGAGNRIPRELLGPDSVIFRIKHLRTSVQHDFQHGPDRKVELKEQIIEAIYREACGRAWPSERDDYRLVQIYLLSEVDRFLMDLNQFLASRSLQSDTQEPHQRG